MLRVAPTLDRSLAIAPEGLGERLSATHGSLKLGGQVALPPTKPRK